jgi:hypothetical protein
LPTKFLYAFLFSPLHNLVQFIFLHVIIPTFGEE